MKISLTLCCNEILTQELNALRWGLTATKIENIIHTLCEEMTCYLGDMAMYSLFEFNAKETELDSLLHHAGINVTTIVLDSYDDLEYSELRPGVIKEYIDDVYPGNLHPEDYVSCFISSDEIFSALINFAETCYRRIYTELVHPYTFGIPARVLQVFEANYPRHTFHVQMEINCENK